MRLLQTKSVSVKAKTENTIITILNTNTIDFNLPQSGCQTNKHMYILENDFRMVTHIRYIL
jgi:iron-sulfur cluster repair protein YtfE (RIC family)